MERIKIVGSKQVRCIKCKRETKCNLIVYWHPRKKIYNKTPAYQCTVCKTEFDFICL